MLKAESCLSCFSPIRLIVIFLEATESFGQRVGGGGGKVSGKERTKEEGKWLHLRNIITCTHTPMHV